MAEQGDLAILGIAQHAAKPHALTSQAADLVQRNPPLSNDIRNPSRQCAHEFTLSPDSHLGRPLMSSGTPAARRRSASLTQVSGKNRRKPTGTGTGTGTSPRARISDTSA